MINYFKESKRELLAAIPFAGLLIVLTKIHPEYEIPFIIALATNVVASRLYNFFFGGEETYDFKSWVKGV